MKIGDILPRNPVFLAPMSGVTDLPFRRLAWRFGAGLVVSEMVASEQLVRAEDEAVLKSSGEGIFPHVVQLAGREAKWMGVAAKRARDLGADIIDINMGCPAKKVTKGYSGSALMRDLDHALTLVETTVEAVDCPVTLKMRLGWDETTINAPELAKRAEDAGIRMVTVHGRTRQQFYKGSADWDAISSVRDAISIPLVANGDISNFNQLSEVKRRSGCDAFMIGRGVYGQPWIVGHLAQYLETGSMPESPSGPVLADIVSEHYEMLLEHYGVFIGIRAARKHLAWYLDADPVLKNTVSDKERQTLMTSDDKREVLAVISDFFSRSEPSVIREKAAA